MRALFAGQTLALLLLTAVGLPVNLSVAGGIRDVSDGWLLGTAAVAEFVSGVAPPAGGAWFTVGQSRLYGMADLPVVAVAAGLHWRAWPGPVSITGRWQTLGAGIYQEDRRELHLQWGRPLVVGLAGRSFGLRTGGTDGTDGIVAQSQGHWQLELTLQVGWHLKEAGRLQVQLWLPLAEGQNQWLAGARRNLVQMQGWQGALAMAVAVELKPDQTPTVNLEWDLAGRGAACGFRVDLDTGTVGPVLYLRRGRLLVRTSHLAHPQLGISHRLEVGLGSWGAPRW